MDILSQKPRPGLQHLADGEQIKGGGFSALLIN